MYRVLKILNNSALVAQDADGNEVLLRSSGIGFNKKSGEQLEITSDTQVSYLTNDTKAKQVLKNVPVAILSLTSSLIELAEQELGATLNQNLIWSLADHISYAVNRTTEDVQLENHIQYEVPYLYFKEYDIGQKIVQVINQELEINLPKFEASYIALHLVNAQLDNGDMSDTLLITEIAKKVITIIQSIFQVSLNKTTANYSRFIIHLHYLISRQKNLPTHGSDTPLEISFSDIIREQYAANYACALMIKDMLLRDYKWQLESHELVYLVIHMERLLQENKIK